MKLYHIYTRQTTPEDRQYHREYYVYAYDELAARVKFNTQLPYSKIESLYTVVRDTPILMMGIY